SVRFCAFYSFVAAKYIRIPNMQVPEDITTHHTVKEMVTVANEYCVYLETAENKSMEGVLKFAGTILPLLYLKGSLLPGVEVEYPEANERFVTEEEWERVFQMLRDKFGATDEFWIIDPQHINETEPLKASLAENLSDIYQDMKDFVLLYQKDTLAALGLPGDQHTVKAAPYQQHP
ncbi:MAG: DUF5063 domain-containing protein, partial [bacterium]